MGKRLPNMTTMIVNPGQPQTFEHYVKLKQPDGTWVVAPVKQQMKTEFFQVQNPDGTIGYISNAPAHSLKTVQIVQQKKEEPEEKRKPAEKKEKKVKKFAHEEA